MASPLELKITRYINGDALIDTLNGAEITLKHTYNPKPGDGETDISETVNLVLEGSQATVQSTINSINRYLADARKRNENGYGDRVYIEARAGTAAAWRRSEILAGRLNVTDDGMQAGLTSNDRTNANLTITRRGYWENTAGTYLPVYNSNGTATSGTALINIYNCADGVGAAPTKRENYVKLPAASIAGDISSPATIYLKQPSFNVQSVYIGKVVANYGATALDMSNYYGDFNVSADASCSGGSYQPTPFTTSSEALIGYKSIQGNAAIKQYGGAPYHALVRFRDNSSLSNMKFRLKLSSPSGVVWTGPQFSLSSTSELVQDFGVINIPPGMSSEWYYVSVEVHGQRTTANTETINIDFIQFFGGEFVKIKEIFPVPDSTIKFGGGNNTLTDFVLSNPASPVERLIGFGSGAIWVDPGKEHAFLFLANGTATAPITHNMGVRMEYRPRWSSPL